MGKFVCDGRCVVDRRTSEEKEGKTRICLNRGADLNILGLGINAFRNAFCLALKLAKLAQMTVIDGLSKSKETGFLDVPRAASKHGENLKTHLFPKGIYSQA